MSRFMVRSLWHQGFGAARQLGGTRMLCARTAQPDVRACSLFGSAVAA